MTNEEGPRTGGGDWDDDIEVDDAWVEPEPGDPCKALIVGSLSLLPEELDANSIESKARSCENWAPVGSSICTPCHRRRIRTRYVRLSLEQRERIAAETGKPLEEIQ